MSEEKEEIKDEKKYNIVYQNDDVVIAFRVKEEEEWLKIVLILIVEIISYLLLAGGVLNEWIRTNCQGSQRR